MKNNVLKGIMVFFLSGLMLANVNVILAGDPSEQHLDTIEGGSGGSGSNTNCISFGYKTWGNGGLIGNVSFYDCLCKERRGKNPLSC